MNKNISRPEIETQKRIIKLFTNELGYKYNGDWSEKDNNTNIEANLLKRNLRERNYTDEEIQIALLKVQKDSEILNNSLYDANKKFYQLLKYGCNVKTTNKNKTTNVHLISWDNEEKNEFSISEEVTLKKNLERRPDLVIYINGIAIAVLELKRSSISINEGIRQSISNQQSRFNEWFYTTIQLVAAGNDSEGLMYGTIKTKAKSFLKWKEDEFENSEYKLDKYIKKIFSKDRILDLLNNFIIFDKGEKKIPRPNQYFAIAAAKENILNKKNGIIWHTQGSGKSLIMALLTKWILENIANSRVLIITDRDELDKQIEGVYLNIGEDIYRTSNGKDLINKLSKPNPRLLCSLIHKFGRVDMQEFEKLTSSDKIDNSNIYGDLYVLVDECHRTQSGKFNKFMKSYLNKSTFIGFTGTPLLKSDKKTSTDIFGQYIHTYLHAEAVEDKVILDLVYEARDVDQQLGSQDKIDKWFNVKTKGLSEWQKASLKKRWGNLQTILSSQSRINKIANDIIFDFSIKPRLNNNRGNAILVAGSIFEACKYYEVFNNSDLKDNCAIVTSYNPHGSDISLEDVGVSSENDKEYVFKIYEHLLKDIKPIQGKSKTEVYEDLAKEKFIKEPFNMKLLIVVDKLLTGFDAPSCTYIYIDKSMQDHGLFQAICRTNRTDGDDKDYGFIVDYKNLLKKVENAISVYSSELDQPDNLSKVDINIKDKFKTFARRLRDILSAIDELCLDVKKPQTTKEYIDYFCGNTEIKGDLKKNKFKRETLYQLTASLLRTYSNLASNLDDAGFLKKDQIQIKDKVKHYCDLKDIIKNASGEYLDLKPYESDMRHLIDTYIEAGEPKKISNFDNLTLVDLIIKTGISETIKSEFFKGLNNSGTISEIIENNIRNAVTKKELSDPIFYEKMSKLLDQVIYERRNKALEYEEYLKKMEELALKISDGGIEKFKEKINTTQLKILFNNLDNNESLALSIGKKLKEEAPAEWRNHSAKEQVLKGLLFDSLGDALEVERIFNIIKNSEIYF